MKCAHIGQYILAYKSSLPLMSNRSPACLQRTSSYNLISTERQHTCPWSRPCPRRRGRRAGSPGSRGAPRTSSGPVPHATLHTSIVISVTLKGWKKGKEREKQKETETEKQIETERDRDRALEEERHLETTSAGNIARERERENIPPSLIWIIASTFRILGGRAGNKSMCTKTIRHARTPNQGI